MAATRPVAKSKPPVERAGNTMPMFTWEGTDKRGTKMKGEQQAKNMNLLRAELRRQGITPTVVKPKAKPLFGAAGKTISARDIAIFSRQIATMMKSGVPLVQSLEIIGNGQKNPRMKQLVDDLRTDIEGGSSIYEAMCSGPMIFELHELRVTAGDDIAFVHGLNRCGGTGPDGKEMVGWMRMTACFRKLHGQWQVVHEHFSAPFL